MREATPYEMSRCQPYLLDGKTIYGINAVAVAASVSAMTVKRHLAKHGDLSRLSIKPRKRRAAA